MKFIKNAINRLMRTIGFKIEKIKFGKKRLGKNLNIGCGNYIIDGFINLDIYTEHYHGNRKNLFKEYNLRQDVIPFLNEEVDNIYISHVIEHIETEFVEKFIKEAHRVLKKEGVLRIACPDAEFLWSVSQFKNGYWSWRKKWFEKRTNRNVTQLDLLIREFSTPKCRFYENKIKHLAEELYQSEPEKLNFKEFINKCNKGLFFREEFPGDHINVWDFNRLFKIGKKTGFRKIIRSKPNGSISSDLQGHDMDKTHPEMSLYVDMLK